MPAGRGGVLHIVGFGWIGVGEEAGVAGYGGVADESAEAGGFGGILALAGADGRVHNLDGGEEVVGFDVLGSLG